MALPTKLELKIVTPDQSLSYEVDEVAMPLGTYRLRARRSAGGHSGLKDVERALGTREYPRLRVGIKPEVPRRVGNLADVVLSPWGREERAGVVKLLPRVQDAVEIWMREGILKAMNAHNGDGGAPRG